MNKYVTIKGLLIPVNADVKIKVDAEVNAEIGSFTFIKISDVTGIPKEQGESYPAYKVLFKDEVLKEYNMQISSEEYVALKQILNIKNGKGDMVREFE